MACGFIDNRVKECTFGDLNTGDTFIYPLESQSIYRKIEATIVEGNKYSAHEKPEGSIDANAVMLDGWVLGGFHFGDDCVVEPVNITFVIN